MRSPRGHILLCFCVAALLAPAPRSDARDRAVGQIEGCALVSPADRPYGTGTAAPGELEAPSAALADRIAFWEQVWGEAGDDTTFLVDARRPELVHAVVTCDSKTAGRAHCGHERSVALRAVRRALSSSSEEARAARAERYAAAPELARDAASHVRAVRGRSDALARAVVRAAPFLVELEEIFRSHGVPGELARLAIVESLFRSNAVSKAGATGAYQFTSATGAQYLTVDEAVDERVDVLRAGDAAARYLAKLHRRFGRFDLALTAYNTGPARLARLIKETGTSDLALLVERARARGLDKRFGFDGENYFAQVLATIRASDALRATTDKGEWTFARVRSSVRAGDLAACLALPLTVLAEVNPSLTERALSEAVPVPKGYVVAVPVANAPRVARAALVVDDQI